MQGFDQEQHYRASYQSPPDHVPLDHPLRGIKDLTNAALKELSRDFNKMYAAATWPSIPPGKLIRAVLIQVLYSIPNERRLIEQLDYNLLFRWFVGLVLDEDVWGPSAFSEDRQRLLDANILGEFLSRICDQAQERGLLSEDYFLVDEAMIEVLSSPKCLPAKDEGSERTGVAS